MVNAADKQRNGETRYLEGRVEMNGKFATFTLDRKVRVKYDGTSYAIQRMRLPCEQIAQYVGEDSRARVPYDAVKGDITRMVKKRLEDDIQSWLANPQQKEDEEKAAPQPRIIPFGSQEDGTSE